jgi:hypothetical protein
MPRLRPILIATLFLSAWGALLPAYFATPLFAQPIELYQGDYAPRDMEELQQLTAPIALYPDAVLAQVLVACTYPDDVVDAARWLSAGNDPSRIDDQGWDPSVKGVARYGGPLNYMASHVDWMNDVGDAFLNQEGDVMTSVQLLRAEANSAGNLVSNDQQQVVVDGDVIEIIPAQPDVIYVPQYDPQFVYVDRRRYVGDRWEPLETFGGGIEVGAWLRHDCDWDDHAVYVGDWGRDRPWWHRGGDDRRGGRDEVRRYADYRPGTYRSTNVTNIRNTTIVNNRTDVRNNVTNVQSGRWQRDARKPAPRPVSRTANRDANVHGDRGYPPAARPAAERTAPARTMTEPARNIAVPQDTRGAVAARASSRGQRSRQSSAAPAAPTPAARPAPAPVARPAPAAAPPPAPAPRAAAAPRASPRAPAPAAPRAAPAARPSAPTRGGAVGGYQNGSDASHTSSRGAGSRGAATAAGHR